MMRSSNLRKVTRARSVDHKCLFQAIGMRWSTQIGQRGSKINYIEMWSSNLWKAARDKASEARGMSHPMSATGMRHIYFKILCTKRNSCLVQPLH